MKALTFASRSPDQHETLGTTFDEDSAVFFMEQLVTVAMENKLVKCMLLTSVYISGKSLEQNLRAVLWLNIIVVYKTTSNVKGLFESGAAPLYHFLVTSLYLKVTLLVFVAKRFMMS